MRPRRCIIKLMENFSEPGHFRSEFGVSQYMAVEALRLTRDDYHHEVSEFKNKRDFVISELESCGIKVEGANGAFDIFFKIPGDANSEEFCEKLLREEKLALVPGIAFGMGRICENKLCFRHKHDKKRNGKINAICKKNAKSD